MQTGKNLIVLEKALSWRTDGVGNGQKNPLGRTPRASARQARRTASAVRRIEGHYVHSAGGGSHGASRSRLGRHLRGKCNSARATLVRSNHYSAAVTGALLAAP